MEQEAKKSIFFAGARPAALWVGVAAMIWAGLIHQVLKWVWAFYEMTGEPPKNIDEGILQILVTGLVLVGGMRSFDKAKGTQTDGLDR